MSCTLAAASRSAADMESRSYQPTVAQWCPTGQYWYRDAPSRTDFSDAIGTQIVVYRCPAEQRTGRSNLSSMMTLLFL
jgi:hypothetical protein